MFKILAKLLERQQFVLSSQTQVWRNLHSKTDTLTSVKVDEEVHESQYTTNNLLKCRDIFDRYMMLPLPETKVHATYVWIDGTGENIRCQSSTLEFNPNSHKDISNSTFNGSQTFQANVSNPDCFIVPVAMYKDPIRKGNSKLILCEAFDADEKPCKTNHRQSCVESLNRACDYEIEVGFEQEYLLTDADGVPFAAQREGMPTELHYAGIGAGKTFGREIAECLYRSCLYAGVDITGDNAEKVLGQWEFRIGPSPMIKAADDLWCARYLLSRIVEDYGIGVTFEPKYSTNHPGSALNTSFSTRYTRGENGLRFLHEAFKKLEKRHYEHMKVYDASGGTDNKRRLTGKFKTSSAGRFTCGIADRTLSVRITKLVNVRKKGYLEDRRPAANADPYRVITALVNTCLLDY